MLTVDRTNWLDASLGRFKTNRIELPRDIPDDFRKHVMNLTRTYERDKDDKKDKEASAIAKYVNTGPDHFAHALTYAEIALQFAPLATTRPLGKSDMSNSATFDITNAPDARLSERDQQLGGLALYLRRRPALQGPVPGEVQPPRD